MLAEKFDYSARKNTVTHVLVLDDCEADCLAIERTLDEIEDCIYFVKTFDTIDGIIAYLEQKHDFVDLCLVDYALGSQNAFDFLQQLKQTVNHPIPIIIMTGHTSDTIDRQLMQLGVQDYWHKDLLNRESLSRSIRYALHRHEQLSLKTNESLNKSRHIAYINHELKNPLNALYGCCCFLELLWNKQEEDQLSQQESEKAIRCFNIMNRSCDTLKLMIDDVLNYSELELKEQKISRAPCDLTQLLATLCEDFSVLANQAGLQLIYRLPDESITVYGEQLKLRQIFSNLISNAIKYTESGFVQLIVKKCIGQNESAKAMVKVEDTGIGIETTCLERIFDEFETPHRRRKNFKKDVDSTGLGLPIVKRFVELHGGSIDVDSVPDKGTHFTVWLPIRMDD